MTQSKLPRLGSVVWANIKDANGFRKVRPAVVVTPTDEIAPGKTVRLAAITTRLPHPLPEDHVLLPWNPQGTARSGLKRRCAVVVSWLIAAAADDVEVAGVLPAAVTQEILAKITRTSAAGPPGGH